MAEEAAGIRVPLLLTLKGIKKPQLQQSPSAPGDLLEGRLQLERRLLPTSDQCGGSEWVQGGPFIMFTFHPPDWNLDLSFFYGEGRERETATWK